MTTSTTTRLRSHRLALVAAAIVVGLGACGSDAAPRTADPSAAPVTTAAPATTDVTTPADADVTTPPADGPPVIRVAEGAATEAGADAPAADSVAASEMDASTKMIAGGIEFVFDGAAEDLTGPAVSWFFDPSRPPSAEQVAALAARFGVEGDVEEVEEERGGGLRVGADDFTGPSVSVSTDAMHSWWYSPGDSLAQQPACEPVVVTDGSDSEEVGCEAPQPPTNVPTEAQAEDKTRALMAELGLEPANYEFQTYADEWGASASAFLVLDGVPTNVSMYFSYGAEGALTWAGGFLATPQRGPEYPRIGLEAAVDRLNSPNWMGGFVDPGLRTEEVPLDDTAEGEAIPDRAADELLPPTDPTTDPGTDAGIDTDAVTVLPAEPVDDPVLVDPAVCDPAADCVPADQEPIVVHLTNPRPALEQLWAQDGTIWLLPGYAFDSDLGLYSVIAIDAAYLAIEEPAPGRAEPAPGDVDTVPSPDGTGGGGTDGAGAAPSPAPELSGLTLEEATKVAEEQGWEVRVVREDGEDFAVTDDYRTDRVNVAVTDGVVTEVVSVG